MSDTIDQNRLLHVSLTARQWNNLLTMANEGLNALNAMMGEIQRQCIEQTRVTPPVVRQEVPANGEERT